MANDSIRGPGLRGHDSDQLCGPRAKRDGKFEMIFVGGHGWITRCKKTRQQVIISGKKVMYVARTKQIAT